MERPSFGGGEPPLQPFSEGVPSSSDELKSINPEIRRVERPQPYETPLTPDLASTGPIEELKTESRPDLELGGEVVNRVEDNFSPASLEDQIGNAMEHNAAK